MVEGSNPTRGKFSTNFQDGRGANPTPWTINPGSFKGLNQGGMALTTHPFIAQRLMKEKCYTSIPN